MNTAFPTFCRSPIPKAARACVAALLLVSTTAAAGRDSSPAPTPAPSAAAPLTLKEAFQEATQTNEQLLIQAENIQQSKARYRQTRGGVLPNVNFIGTETLQDTSGSSSGSSNSVASTLTKRTREQAQINLSQPFFQGFKEYAALDALRADERRQRLLYQRQATLLFQDVALAFFQVVSYETQLADLQSLMKLSSDRIKDLHNRVNLGKSRGSDITSAESQLANYRAQEAALRGQVAQAREQLSFLVGEDLSTRAIQDNVGLPHDAPPLDEAVQHARDRSDVAALREEVEGLRAGVRVAQAGYYPSLVGSANYYLYRPGFQKDIHWDAVFTLTAPIYRGGTIRAMTDEAKSLLRQAERSLSYQERSATTDVRKAHALLASSIDQAALLGDAVRQSRNSYDAIARDYKLGLNDNLEVLTALDNLEAVRRDHDVALLQSKLNLLNLRLAAEMAPENLP